jgi:hypothetical protein
VARLDSLGRSIDQTKVDYLDPWARQAATYSLYLPF